jgi:hypothetical protein
MWKKQPQTREAGILLFKTSGFWPRVRARLFELIATQTGRCAPPPRPTQLRCFSFDPQKYIKSIELGPPTSKALFFPLDHMQTEEAMKCEVTCPRPTHRSFADPSSNILGSKLCTGATIRPNFFGFSFLLFLDLFFLLLSAFSYLLLCREGFLFLPCNN